MIRDGHGGRLHYRDGRGGLQCHCGGRSVIVRSRRWSGLCTIVVKVAGGQSSAFVRCFVVEVVEVAGLQPLFVALLWTSWRLRVLIRGRIDAPSLICIFYFILYML